MGTLVCHIKGLTAVLAAFRTQNRIGAAILSLALPRRDT